MHSNFVFRGCQGAWYFFHHSLHGQLPESGPADGVLRRAATRGAVPWLCHCQRRCCRLLSGIQPHHGHQQHRGLQVSIRFAAAAACIAFESNSSSVKLAVNATWLFIHDEHDLFCFEPGLQSSSRLGSGLRIEVNCSTYYCIYSSL